MTGRDGIAGDRLRSFIERIQRIEEDLKAMNQDKKDVFAEAKGEGFDAKILRRFRPGNKTRRSVTNATRWSTLIFARSKWFQLQGSGRRAS